MEKIEVDELEAADDLERLINRVNRGDLVVVTRRGRAVAKLAPSEPPPSQAPDTTKAEPD